MSTKFVYKGISFRADPHWENGERKYPYIKLIYDDTFLECMRTGQTKEIYEIFTEWGNSELCRKFYEVAEFYDENNAGMSVEEILCNEWEWNLTTLDTSNTEVGKFKYRNSTPEEVYQKDLKTITKLNGYLANEFIKEEHRLAIRKFLEKHNEPRTIKPKVPVSGYIYLISSCGLYKIGKAKNLTNRTSYFSTHIPVEVTLIHSFHSLDYTKAESFLHRKYSSSRKTGEWFDLTDSQVAEIYAIKDDEI